MKVLVLFLGFAAFATVSCQKATRHTVNFQHYYDLEETEHFLEDMALDFPEKVFLEDIGTTSEGRSIKALRISVSNSRRRVKPMIVVASGLRAREWIAPMVNLYFVHMLLEHTTYERILREVDFLFIPVVNPDGFVYSHTTDRDWVKNRKDVGSGCFGVNLNRNFDFKFNASSDPCSDDFSGTAAASEPETQAIQNVLAKYQKQIKVFVNLQAFGQKILLPFNYGQQYVPRQYDLYRWAQYIASRIYRVNNTRYEVATGYRASRESGTPSDYAFGKLRIPVAYTIELPRGGSSGYEIPEDQLDFVLRESFEGFLAITYMPK